ncbi:MAG: SDR family NAD(P)-dependent oxidoreductase [Pseudomonadota bacterium]
MKKITSLEGCVAVVTGAGSGIGRELALQLAERGAKLALSDVDPQALDKTVKMLSETNAEVLADTLDVSNQTAMSAYAARIEASHGHVNLLINNAGVALASGYFKGTTIDEFEWLMRINFSGVLYGSKAFLPLLERGDWGHIVNISSVFGLIAVAEQAAYNSSKFAVRGFTEAICDEFELTSKTLGATCVHPGGVKTNIARNARLGEQLDDQERDSFAVKQDLFDKLARTTAESAAKQILQAVQLRQRRLLIGADAKLLDKIQRVLPASYNRVVSWMSNRIRKREGLEPIGK